MSNMHSVHKNFKILPIEYQNAIFKLQNEYGISLEPVGNQLTNGRSEAVLYHVRIQRSNSNAPERLILKVYKTKSRDVESEAMRHALAIERAPLDFQKNHLVKMAYQPLLVNEELTVCLFEIAGHSLLSLQPIANYNKVHTIQSIFSKVGWFSGISGG